MTATIFIIAGCVLATFATVYFYGIIIRTAYRQVLAEQLADFSHSRDEMLAEAENYTSIHIDNASRVIAIIEAHLMDTETELDGDLQKVFDEICSFYEEGTLH